MPDMVVAVVCTVLILVVGWFVFKGSPRSARDSTVIPFQLRSIHQAMLLYGFDNHDYLPGLNPDGSLLTNEPVARFSLLLKNDYLMPGVLVSPAESNPQVHYSYAMLDIAEPGERRAVWTTEAAPDWPILAERYVNEKQPGDWSGWVLFHRDYLVPGVALSEKIGPPAAVSGDALFEAVGPDDVYLIDAGIK